VQNGGDDDKELTRKLKLSNANTNNWFNSQSTNDEILRLNCKFEYERKKKLKDCQDAAEDKRAAFSNGTFDENSKYNDIERKEREVCGNRFDKDLTFGHCRTTQNAK